MENLAPAGHTILNVLKVCFQNTLNTWICSTLKFQLFRMATKIGLIAFIPIPIGVLLTIFYFLGIHFKMSSAVFDVVATMIGVMGIAITLSGIWHFPNKSHLGKIAIELRYGVLGIHMWKRVPPISDLRNLLLRGIEVGQQTGARILQIKSPLLVDRNRVRLLELMIERLMNENNISGVSIEVTPPEYLGLTRAIGFSVFCFLAKIDKTSKHLPADLTFFKVKSAGIRINFMKF